MRTSSFLAEDVHPVQLQRFDPIVARLGLLATGSFLLFAGYIGSFANFTHHKWLVFVDLAELIAAFAFLVTALATPLVPRPDRLVLAGVILAASLTYVARIPDTDYPSDVIVFGHAASNLVLHGENPYSQHDRALLVRESVPFGLPPFFITQQADGDIIDRLSVYPAGEIYAFLPFAALDLDVRWGLAAAQVAIFVLLWSQAPRALRPLVAMPLLVDPTFFAITNNDQLWQLPLMGAVIFLNRRRFTPSAALFGLAAAAKQQPWVLVPFLAIWLWQTGADENVRKRAMRVVRFGVTAATAFLLVNLPFMVWSFGDWLSALTFHLYVPLVFIGIGLSNLTTQGVVDWGRSVYTAASTAALILLLLAYLRFFPRLKHAVWVFPGIVFWFTYRSPMNYLEAWTPLLALSVFYLVGEATSGEGDRSRPVVMNIDAERAASVR